MIYLHGITPSLPTFQQKGTLLAIAITYAGYISYGIMMGACAIREASGLLSNETGLPIECTGVDCEFGLLRNYQVIHIRYVRFNRV
jgi:hypothetical protein